MATSCSDVINTLSQHLRSSGYAIHNGDAETGVTVQDESGADWWFTWSVAGMAEAECGPTVDSALQAEESAMTHFFANAVIHVDAVDSAEREMRSLLAEAERFLFGFEGDALQSESIDDLLVRIRLVTNQEGAASDATRALQLADHAASSPSYFVMIDGEQSVAHRPTIEEARAVGQALADAEPIPCAFSIQTADGAHVEDIKRTDGATLSELVRRSEMPLSTHANLLAVIAADVKNSTGCRADEAQKQARYVADPAAPLDFSRWRHGGWYVHGVRYPGGACGCVSRNYADRKWRIVCDRREGLFTYPSREAAARAEQAIALAAYKHSAV